MTLALIADKLTGMRGERRLFEALSFEVGAGQALALEGPNGTGKTSLLRMVAGFLMPVAGRITLRDEGRPLMEPEERQPFIAWLGHHDALKGSFTVTEQLAFFARLHGVAADLAALLDQVGLTRQAGLPCRYLSAGQRRRLGLARLLAAQRPLWLLDEPFAALDSAGKALVAQLIARHCGQGGVVMAATHEPLGLSNPVLKL
jgi:heme exporter protein A